MTMKTSCILLLGCLFGSSWNHQSAFAFVATKPTRHSVLLPWITKNAICQTQLQMASIAPGSRVLVVGGTSGVGQLVTKKLQASGRFDVCVTSRNVPQAQEVLGDDVNVVELDLVQGTEAQLQRALQGVSAMVVSVGTTAFPTLKWRGGNTPQAIDDVAVTRLANAAAKIDSLQKIVLVTSVGVDRRDQMPFLILNLFGVLDAKKNGEDAVKAAVARKGGVCDYVIVRPGRLVGGPFTNLDVARLLQIEGGAENGVDVAVGDVLLGDCKRDACAEAIVQCLTNDACSNLEFSIVSNDKKALSDDQWTKAFRQMQTSERQKVLEK